MGIRILGSTPSGKGESLPTASASGIIESGNSATLIIVSLDDGKKLNISEATLILSDGQPSPTDLNLIIATLDGAGNGTQQSTIINGDGSTHYVDMDGDPYDSYTNNSGGNQTVGILIDNGQFGSGTGSTQDCVAEVEYEKITA